MINCLVVSQKLCVQKSKYYEYKHRDEDVKFLLEKTQTEFKKEGL